MKERQHKKENGYTKDLEILRDMIRNLDFELTDILKKFDGESKEQEERYGQMEYDLRGMMALYLKCKSLYKIENLNEYKENKKFKLKVISGK